MKRLIILCALLFIGLCANSNAENLDSLNQFTGWDYSGEIRTQKLKTAGYTYSQLMQNGNELFTADKDGFIRIWNLETGKLRYSISIDYSTVIASYHDSLFYYVPKNSNNIYCFNILSDSVRYLDNFRKDGEFTFHPNNFISYPIKIEMGMDFDVYYKLISIAIDCDTSDNMEMSKKFYYGGYGYKYGKSISNYIYHQTTARTGYFPFDSSSTVVMLGDSKFAELPRLSDNCSFSINDDYVLSGGSDYYKRDELLIYKLDSNLTYKKAVMPFNFKDFVIDYRDRIVAIDEYSNTLNIATWKNGINNKEIKLPEIIGSDSRIINNYDSSAVILTNNYGNLLYAPLFENTELKAIAYIDRKDITVGEQISFANYSSGKCKYTKWLINNEVVSEQFDFVKIFKQAGDYDVTLIVSDGVNYDTTVYKNMIHVTPKYKPLLANYSEDRRFGYLPLTVNFKNTTNKPYSSIEWDFGDGTTSNEENPQHSFYQYGKFVVTLTLVSNGDTLRLSKDFNVVNRQLQDGWVRIGEMNTSIPNTWSKGYYYTQLLTFERDEFYFNLVEFNSLSGSSQSGYSSSSTLKFYKGWEIPFEIKNNDMSFRRYIDGGIVTNHGTVYNNSGRILFETEHTTPGTIIPDRNRDSLISYDENKIYYCDQYFDPIWNKDFYELTNDSCKVLNVSSMYNGNIALFLYLKNALKVVRYEINPISSQVIENNWITQAENNEIIHINDDFYCSKINTNLVSFDKKGNPLNTLSVGTAMIYKMDSSLVLAVNWKNYMPMLMIYNRNLELACSFQDTAKFDSYCDINNFYTFMLTDKSIVIVENHYAYPQNFVISRWFIPEIYNKQTSIGGTQKSVIRPVSYPLPAVDEVSIGLDSIGTAESIEVMDLSGNLCNAAIKSSDSNTLILDISKLGPGTYFYTVNSNGKQYQGKFIKQK